jgi:hypothetical protein
MSEHGRYSGSMVRQKLARLILLLWPERRLIIDVALLLQWGCKSMVAAESIYALTSAIVWGIVNSPSLTALIS